ncbi:HET-domain-containing protein [Corynespora cassiicola Philippines]|uniref:HET-domain-containing protein n=1 Tax=Corynespora cassiicola Philippines TaxID=1448308 RepID=A0A2T2N3Q3_CORCC|nr:HET-domain-containing protein [Corynespora cassiicola Philippines]
MELDQKMQAESNYHPYAFKRAEASRYIRLLRVIPRYKDDKETTIKCQFLSKRRVDGQSSLPPENLEYTALSYEWGTASQMEDIVEIKINNRPFYVRQNLSAFLLAMRNKGNEGPFWIDAICIDQLNDGEKSMQLELVPTIYSQAKEVLIWLGDGKMSMIQWTVLRFSDVTGTSYYHGRFLKPMWGLYKMLIQPGVRFLAENTYWTRLWIVQEVLKAHHVKVLAADQEWYLEELKNLRKMMSSSSSINWKCWEDVVEARSGWNKEEHELHDVIDRWSQQGCRDTQDKVYGLLGLVTSPRLRVDFKKTPFDLFKEVLQLEREKIYAIGYEYADKFSLKLMESLNLADDENAIRVRDKFLQKCLNLPYRQRNI